MNHFSLVCVYYVYIYVSANVGSLALSLDKITRSTVQEKEKKTENVNDY